MTIRSINWAVGVSLVAAVLTVGTILPASAQVTAVPREGVAFNDTVTQRVKIETVDPDDRTVAFTLSDGQVLVLPVSSNAGNLAAIADGINGSTRVQTVADAGHLAYLDQPDAVARAVLAHFA